jgi:hypothetical protein
MSTSHDVYLPLPIQVTAAQSAGESAVQQVAKNIALAGVGSLSLLDDAPCKSEAAACNFLISADADQAQRWALHANE